MARDSVDSVAIRYGLDGPEIESRWGARFYAPVQDAPSGLPSLLCKGYRMIPWATVAGVWR
jgi:hypothetical protein